MKVHENIEDVLIDGARTSVNSTYKTADAFKNGLERTVMQIDSGFRITMYMYVGVFITGVFLLCCGVYMAFATDKEIVSALFGGMGLASILSFFFSQTPIELQKSRGELARLQSILFNWYVDLTNWNSFLLHRPDISLDEFHRISDILMKRTEESAKLLEQRSKIES